MDLAREGGYEAVQMRDVAARADVALGTVYRYFASKDQLLTAVWTTWRNALEDRLHGQPLVGPRAQIVSSISCAARRDRSNAIRSSPPRSSRRMRRPIRTGRCTSVRSRRG